MCLGSQIARYSVPVHISGVASSSTPWHYGQINRTTMGDIMIDSTDSHGIALTLHTLTEDDGSRYLGVSIGDRPDNVIEIPVADILAMLFSPDTIN